MIDLSVESIHVQTWMDENIVKFLSEIPSKPPGEICLYSSPANGWVSLCFDIEVKEDYPKTNCPTSLIQNIRFSNSPLGPTITKPTHR